MLADKFNKGGDMGAQDPLDAPYKKGDVIGGEYEILDIIGHGYFGVVYKVYSKETRDVYALKTLLNERFEDPRARELFFQEANIWVNLGVHPYVVEAHQVQIIDGRMHVALEYIAPSVEGAWSTLEWRELGQPNQSSIAASSNEEGKSTLEWHLEHDPPDLSQALRWAIQFCYGMEHAYSRKIRCHGDIKTDNILISPEKTLKITDFGWAVAECKYRAMSRGARSAGSDYDISNADLENDLYDERADIRDFGIVLDTIALAIPQQSVSYASESPLNQIIKRCRESDGEHGYQTFEKLHQALEDLLRGETGETFAPPSPEKITIGRLNSRGNNLSELGRHEEAIECFDCALDKLGPSAELMPSSAGIWNNKGHTLYQMKDYAGATTCLDKALNLVPNFGNALYNSGLVRIGLEDFDSAVDYLDKFIYLSPDEIVGSNSKVIRRMRPEALYHKANCVYRLGRQAEAIKAFDEAIRINPKRAVFHNDKGCTLAEMHRYDDAIECFDAAIEIDLHYPIAKRNKSMALLEEGNELFVEREYHGARSLFSKSAEIDPLFPDAWRNKALVEDSLDLHSECVQSWLRFLTVAPIDYSGLYFRYVFQKLGLGRLSE